MSYIDKNSYFAELNGSNGTATSAGANGAGSGIKAVLSFGNQRHWLSANGSNTDFTSSSECLIQGSSLSANSSSSDFYHKYGVTGNNLSCSYLGQTNAESARSYSKIDEDLFSISNAGTFSVELLGKHNGGTFCNDNTKFIVLRLGY